ncbi:MAG: restriction endonuclease [Candidatus Aenigmarchaeota archaeon]|nr:restriction endonuclease [Candidatus Aenigmarchaeota archaeon]
MSVEINRIVNELAQTKNIEDLLEKYNWKTFEDFVEFVFQQHDFKTKKNFRFKTKKRYEIDIVAERDVVFCVDCKRWGRGRYKKHSLIKSSEKLLERVGEFKNYAKIKKQVLPLIITLWDEGFYMENKTFFVPIWKLNEFLLSEFWR